VWLLRGIARSLNARGVATARRSCLGVKKTFRRVIVWPDRHKEIEGVTSKALPSPSSHILPNAEESQADPSETES
jgi:hypothetical protein